MRGAMALLKVPYKVISYETGVCVSTLTVIAGAAQGRVSDQTRRLVRAWFEKQGVIFFSCETLWRDGVALKDLPKRVYVPEL